MSTFTVYEQLYPKPVKGCRYRLVENVVTYDGIRSRLTDSCTDDPEVAKAWALGREAVQNRSTL